MDPVSYDQVPANQTNLTNIFPQHAARQDKIDSAARLVDITNNAAKQKQAAAKQMEAAAKQKEAAAQQTREGAPELSNLKMRALQSKAAELGIAQLIIDEADDKAELIGIIMAHIDEADDKPKTVEPTLSELRLACSANWLDEAGNHAELKARLKEYEATVGSPPPTTQTADRVIKDTPRDRKLIEMTENRSTANSAAAASPPPTTQTAGPATSDRPSLAASPVDSPGNLDDGAKASIAHASTLGETLEPKLIEMLKNRPGPSIATSDEPVQKKQKSEMSEVEKIMKQDGWEITDLD